MFETISVAVGIIVGILVILRTVVIVTKHLVHGSTKLDVSVTNLSNAIKELARVMETGLAELHARVDQNDTHISEINLRLALVMQRLDIKYDSNSGEYHMPKSSK